MSTYQQKNVLARLEPVSGFPSLYVVVFIVVSDFEERVGFVDIDGIVDHRKASECQQKNVKNINIMHNWVKS
jgi:hypothetical protein